MSHMQKELYKKVLMNDFDTVGYIYIHIHIHM